nr:hypothetical protein CFP56_16832 [Quercus suber]
MPVCDELFMPAYSSFLQLLPGYSSGDCLGSNHLLLTYSSTASFFFMHCCFFALHLLLPLTQVYPCAKKFSFSPFSQCARFLRIQLRFDAMKTNMQDRCLTAEKSFHETIYGGFCVRFPGGVLRCRGFGKAGTSCLVNFLSLLNTLAKCAIQDAIGVCGARRGEGEGRESGNELIYHLSD